PGLFLRYTPAEEQVDRNWHTTLLTGNVYGVGAFPIGDLLNLIAGIEPVFLQRFRQRVRKYNADRRIGRNADDLGVEVVAHTDEGAGKGDQDNDAVDHTEEVLSRLFLSVVQPECCQYTNGCSVAGQSLQSGKAKG